MATQISLHTLVSFVMKPLCTRAVLRFSLLGEQGADVSRDLLLIYMCKLDGLNFLIFIKSWAKNIEFHLVNLHQ